MLCSSLQECMYSILRWIGQFKNLLRSLGLIKFELLRARHFIVLVSQVSHLKSSQQTEPVYIYSNLVDAYHVCRRISLVLSLSYSHRGWPFNSNTMPNKAAAPEAPKEENGVPDLAGKRVLVPARIFPKEKPPKGKVGWVAKVLGPSKTAPNHFDVAFPGTLIYERWYLFTEKCSFDFPNSGQRQMIRPSTSEFWT